jgi:deoxyribonucleoside regulator
MKGEVYNQSKWIVMKAAYFYYVHDKPLKEVADILNVSKSTVSRLIKRAKKERIVEFVMPSPYKQCLELEHELVKRFKLKEAIVVPSVYKAKDVIDAEKSKMSVALEGARYIQRIITSNDILGIAWGGTMYYLINYLNPCQKTYATFVTLHGSLSCCDYELDVNTLVPRMSMAFGGRHYSLSYEGLLSSEEKINLLKSKKDVKQVFSLFNKLSISVSGIGSFYPKLDSPLSRLQYLQADELVFLQGKGVYGDIMLRFFDENGKECDTNLKRRTLTIDMDTYKEIPCKIIVASGVQKAKTLQAALKGKLVDVLIIDSALAQAIVIQN